VKEKEVKRKRRRGRMDGERGGKGVEVLL